MYLAVKRRIPPGLFKIRRVLRRAMNYVTFVSDFRNQPAHRSPRRAPSPPPPYLIRLRRQRHQHLQPRVRRRPPQTEIAMMLQLPHLFPPVKHPLHAAPPDVPTQSQPRPPRPGPGRQDCPDWAANGDRRALTRRYPSAIIHEPMAQAGPSAAPPGRLPQTRRPVTIQPPISGALPNA